MIIIVSPWYGPDTRGGAETQARSLAQTLHRQGVPVQVWASTGRDSFHPGEDSTTPPVGAKSMVLRSGASGPHLPTHLGCRCSSASIATCCRLSSSFQAKR
ncbi:MAG: glycosyltransferase family 4 protein [Chloroflexaceae bacterium]|nr:glycosyltransferase family 4 protein [Chloroflexaceae bacterium]